MGGSGFDPSVSVQGHSNILPSTPVSSERSFSLSFQPKPCMHFLPPYVPHARPISFIWLSKYLMNSRTHEVSLYVLFTNSLLLPPFSAQMHFHFMYFSPIPSYFRPFGPKWTFSLCTFHQFPLTSALLGPNEISLYVLFTNSLLLPPFWAQIKFLFIYFSPIPSYFRPFGPK